MEFFRTQLVVTNDDEWKVIEGRLSKVTQTRMEMLANGAAMSSFRRMMAGANGGNGVPAGAMRGFPGLGNPSPEVEALEKNIDNNAPEDQIKASLQKYRDLQKKKEAELKTAQKDLRQVLTVRQEAVLVSIGVLD